ncbi:hypothetical protein BCR34DRAFT_597001 [Clohesyomyces aquaticus]|uniref:Uncharacterized protein n=1 Tax=Clohesyomyces aquaticus TaxID=1231657 RepID=A0A1Y2A4U7_9PLEO|nr:hypothetical protein BCR34DRAFT_597001 [Clohesyomyces aquaticus]
MKSIQQLVVLFFALFAFALAQEETYDATVYVTSTVYKVNTVTMSGTPTGAVSNSTTTIVSYPSVGTVLPGYSSANLTSAPTHATPTTTAKPSQFTGAASQLNVNAVVAILAAGVGYLAL